jgi:hypothetical protein
MGFGTGICDPQIPAKNPCGNLQFPLLWPPNDGIDKSLHQILASPQIPPPNTSSKHTIKEFEEKVAANIYYRDF